MKIQMLVSAVNQDVRTLAERMNIRTDAVIINQCGAFGYEEYERGNHTIRCYSFRERGVGLSRNNALMRADAEISVFADEDIVYDEGYEKKIEETFAGNREMDMILFNVKGEACPLVQLRQISGIQHCGKNGIPAPGECGFLLAVRRRSQIQQWRGQPFFKGLSAAGA